MTAPASVHVSAVCLLHDGRVLVVRKRGTELFQLPGGKPEPGEDAERAARRETAEEVGVELGELLGLGRFRAAAAHEPDTTVVADVFVADERRLVTTPRALAEIAELAWVPVTGPTDAPLAPLMAPVLEALREHEATQAPGGRA